MSFRLIKCLNYATTNVSKSVLIREPQFIWSQSIGGVNFNQARWSTSFFTRLNAQQIWKGVTSVSNAGKKRGRGKGAGKSRAKDLNKGQQIGVGPLSIIWPGLNSHVIKGKETVEIKEAPKQDNSFEQNLTEIRNQLDTYVKVRVNPLSRGWSGGSPRGTWTRGKDIYPDKEALHDFVCTIIESKLKMTPRAGKGKVPNLRNLAIIGNQNGIVGLGKANADNMRDSITLSYADAMRNCIAVPICDGHTIFHDFHARFFCNKIYAFKMPPGYGLVCHRVIRDLCIAVGIKDIFVKSEGNQENYLNVARAFISGLFNQKNFQEMANEKRLHLVEFREENGLYPKVLASPSDGKVRKLEEVEKDEYTDFHMYINNGKVMSTQQKRYPDYIRTLGYGKHLIKYHYHRNRQLVRAQLRAKYGAVESFLTIREKEERAKRATAS